MDTKSFIYFFSLSSLPMLLLPQSPSISHPEFLLAGALSAIAAAISNAGGIGGGGLFVPILTVVAGLDVKTATTFSAFMVTGGSAAKIACHAVSRESAARIEYDMVLQAEAALLLGVSCGVILHRVLPEWVITVLFAVFIGVCTLKTCKSGVLHWRRESEEGMSMSGESTRMPLLLRRRDEEEGKSGIPWKKVGMLVAIWVSFFLVNLLRGNTYGQGIMKIKSCGKTYWIISGMQIPIALAFTTWILFPPNINNNNNNIIKENGGGFTAEHSMINRCRRPWSTKLIFPVMALLAGVMGGVFGIGGGMVMTPLLLQLGIEPQVTAVTSSFIVSFIVSFSATMSATQYALLGMEDINRAVVLGSICFVASVIGSTLLQRLVVKYGRASVIVFVIGTVMGVSTVVMTSYGAVKTWRDYVTGKSMGFNKPC